jgi:hypothetical protein
VFTGIVAWTLSWVETYYSVRQCAVTFISEALSFATAEKREIGTFCRQCGPAYGEFAGLRSIKNEERCALCHKKLWSPEQTRKQYYNEAQFLVDHGCGHLIPGSYRPNGNVLVVLPNWIVR